MATRCGRISPGPLPPVTLPIGSKATAKLPAKCPNGRATVEKTGASHIRFQDSGSFKSGLGAIIAHPGG